MSRAEPARPLRKLLVLVTAFVAPALGQLHELTGLGKSVAEFGREGDEVVRAATWAFAIWGPIYLYLWIHAVAQALSREDEAVQRRLGWPSVVALAGIGVWTLAAQFGGDLLTPVIIVVSLLACLMPLWAAGPTQDGAGLMARALAVWPLAALGGWLTVATVLNFITLAQRYGLLDRMAPEAWGVAGVVIVGVVALATIFRTRLWVYGLPVAWGLVAVYFAEAQRHPTTAWAAVAGAAVVLLAVLVRGRR